MGDDRNLSDVYDKLCDIESALTGKRCNKFRDVLASYGWNKFDDVLPNDGQSVVVLDDSGKVMLMYFINEHLHYTSGGTYTSPIKNWDYWSASPLGKS